MTLKNGRAAPSPPTEIQAREQARAHGETHSAGIRSTAAPLIRPAFSD